MGQIMVCRECGRVLDRVEMDGVDSLEHPASGPRPDHAPDPVPEGTVPTVGFCDFCFTAHPAWVLPARDFEVMPGHMSSGGWSACEACMRLIETNQWNGVIRRAKVGWESRHGVKMPAEVAAGLSRMYRQLREHVSGSAVRLDDLTRAQAEALGIYGKGAKSDPQV